MGFKLKMLGEGNLNPSHCYQFGAGPSSANASSRCPELGEESQFSRREPAGQCKGTPDSKSASLGAQLNCLYAKACNMGNKEEESETCHTCRVMVSLTSRRHSAMALRTAVLEWKYTGSLGRTGR